MRIFYTCAYCAAPIDILEVQQVEETKLGFDCLTEEERRDIIKIDNNANAMYVNSLCDDCIQALGLADDQPKINPQRFLH